MLLHVTDEARRPRTNRSRGRRWSCCFSSPRRLYRAEELPTRRERGVELRQLIPQAIPGVTLERMSFAPGARLSGAPHPPGSAEYLAVEAGAIQLTTPDARWRVEPGEVVHYRGDQTHGYHNPTDQPALAFTLILPSRQP